MKKILFLIILFPSLLFAGQIKGEYQPIQEDSVCMLILKVGKYVGVCSATLIDTDKLLTARHCLISSNDPDTKFEITDILCGFIGGKYVSRSKLGESMVFKVRTDKYSSVITIPRPTNLATKRDMQYSDGSRFYFHPEMKERTKFGDHTGAEKAFKTNQGFDFAVVTLKEPISDKATKLPPVSMVNKKEFNQAVLNYIDNKPVIVPMELPTSIEEIETTFFQKNGKSLSYVLKPKVECNIAGYGRDNEGAHTFKVASIKRTDLLKMELSPVYQNHEDFPVMVLSFMQSSDSNYPDFGDSGGPLYCRKDSHSNWMLIGVNSTAGHPSRGETSWLWSVVGTPIFNKLVNGTVDSKELLPLAVK